ncbi:MAG: efflux RND transporter periplasmic adaptor subunit [Ahrensia sp.]|nr:efflux RND transporter periplasmic adaptor subunit [Ahrensia sp.]
MALRGSHLVALAILAGIGGWMLTGELIEGGQADADKQTIAEREAAKTAQAFRVRFTEVNPTERPASLTVRGRTEASASVTVRAETGGNISAINFTKGQMVKKGDLLCSIDQGVRMTELARVEATLTQAQADYDATKSLVDRGFATKTKLRGLRSALDAAKAAVAQAQQDIGRTDIVATSSGQLMEPFAEAGDNLAPGGVCATLMQMDPMLFTGQVPEREIGAISEGMDVSVSLVSGGNASGTIRYISPAADAQTRTFEVEVALDNADSRLRDGMTSTATIPLPPISAYRLRTNWLTLNDAGQVGVRTVQSDNTVAFVPVTILTQEADGVWVRGLEPGTRVITLGQNYVAAGEAVDPVAEEEATPSERASSEASS